VVKKFIEGSMAVAEFVGLCRPDVISAYPITPQTHIVEELAQMVADGDVKSQFINVESEFAAASVVLGASATGARTYTATSSQGLLLMTEVLYNIAGMRLPIVLTCANRAISAPINIWNDHQDSISVRDAGWIQLYAEDNQDAADMHIQAYKIAEDNDILLPVMVCMDGFILTHSFEPVDVPSSKEVDAFLPKFNPEIYLTPKQPLSLGLMAAPDSYMETRFSLFKTLEESKDKIVKVAREFKKTFGRSSGELVEQYKIEGADIILVAMGSIVSTMKVVVDKLREGGKKVGLLKIRCHRPFPEEEIKIAFSKAKNIAVLEKAVSMGFGGILAGEIRSALSTTNTGASVSNFIIGLGGRDITQKDIVNIVDKTLSGPVENEFVNINLDLLDK